MRLRHIVGIGRFCRDRVRQARVSVHANMSLHAIVPLGTFLDLVRLRVAVVLGGTGAEIKMVSTTAHVLK